MSFDIRKKSDTTVRNTAAIQTAQEETPRFNIRKKTAAVPTQGTVTDTKANEAPEPTAKPTFGERVGKTLVGAAEQYGAGFVNAAGLASAGQNGTTTHDTYREQAEGLDREIAALEKNVNDKTLTVRQRADAATALATAKEQRALYAKALNANRKTAGEVYKVADTLSESGAKDIERAKEGLGKLGSLAVDVGAMGAQMGADIALGAATGGGALAPMFVRSMGGGAQQARQEGATHTQQVNYGLASGALSVATEKISNVASPFKKAFGGGVLDKAIEKALGRMNGSRAGKIALSFLSEGSEEMVEDIVQPLLQTIYNGQSIGESYQKNFDLSEMLYDGLIGGILGGLGGGVEAIGSRKTYSDRTATPENTWAGSTTTVQENTTQGTEENSTPSTSVNADAAGHTETERQHIADYQAAADSGIVAFVQKVRTLKNQKYRNSVRYPISNVSAREASAVQEKTGINTEGFTNILTGSAVDHIEKRHGANGRADRSMSDLNDLSRVGYILENFDNAELLKNEDGSPSVSDVWKNSDGSPAARMLFTKKVDGVYYTAVATPDSNAGVIAIESAFMSKEKGSTGTVLNMEGNSLQVTSEAPQRADASFSTATVAQEREGVKQTAGQTEPAQKTDGIVLPTSEETGGVVLPTAETQTAQAKPATAEARTEAETTWRAPGVLPTAEEAETQQRAARAETETERTGILAGVDEDTIAKVQRISNIVGREVVFFDEGADNAGGMHNGKYNTKTGIIYINAQSPNPVAQIISHELTHSIEESGHYSDLQKLVLNRIRQTGGDLQAMRRQKAELYARHGEILKDNADVDSEIVAEYVEKYLLTDEQTIRAMVQQNRTLGQRILQFINELLAKLGNSDAQERAFLTQAKNYYQSALQETQSSFNAQERTYTQAQKMDNLRERMENGEISDEDAEAAFNEMYDPELDMRQGLGRLQHSYGGENANGANLESLREAQAMQEAGADMESIRKATGWHEGMDGKWRWEIDDSGMTYHRPGAERGRARLEDILDHEELFRAYPQLRRTKVEFADLPKNTVGSYSPSRDLITLSSELRNAPQDTLIHEIQHAIQNAEGFSGGASPEYWARREYESGDFVTERLQGEYDRLLNSLSRDEQNRYIRYTELEREMERLFLSDEASEDGKRYAKLEAEQDALYAELYPNQWFRDLLDLNRRMNDAPGEYGKMYRNTAGEIEARDVAKRRELTAEERRETAPDYGSEDTVFADGGESYSISNTRDMPWKDQVRGYFSNDGTIKSSDSLYLGESGVDGVEDAPMYIPTSVITKALRPPKGSRSAHALSQRNILSLQEGIKNAPVVIDNPARNSIVYVTADQDSAGNYIIAALDKNNDLYGENAHKVTSIHGRENIAAMLEKLGDDATVFVRNENKLNQMLPGNQILKSLALRAKVELDDGSVSDRGENVKPLTFEEEVMRQLTSRKETPEHVEPLSLPKPETKVRFSLDEDSEGRKLTEAQKRVNEAAERAGYNSPDLYHGTKSFGFTEFDLSKMDDGTSIFLTTSPTVAATYTAADAERADVNSLHRNPKAPNDRENPLKKADAETAPLSQLLSAWNSEAAKNGAHRYKATPPAEVLKRAEQQIEAEALRLADAAEEYAEQNSGLSTPMKRFLERTGELTNYSGKRLYQEIATLKAIESGFAEGTRPDAEMNAFAAATGGIPESAASLAQAALSGEALIEAVPENGRSVRSGHPVSTTETKFRAFYRKQAERENGIYRVRARLRNPLVVDAKGAEWADVSVQANDLANGKNKDLKRLAAELGLTVEDEGGLFTKRRSLHGPTRSWAQYAKNNKYDGVIFKNLYDPGADVENEANGTSDVYIVFDPAQVKSTEEVTYDDGGNEIPLSRRFDTGNADIRYSVDEIEGAEEAQPSEEDKAAPMPGASEAIEQQWKGESGAAADEKDSIRTTLPKKAQDYLKRTERSLVRRVSRALSVPRFAQREYLQEIAQKISEEYLTTGRVSEETAAEMFERAYSEGIVVDEEFYREYKNIKDHLRTQAVTISETDRHDIADWGDFRKSAFGTLRIVNEGGLPVDVAYQELQGMAPELFPDNLTHPADQLVRMFEVAQSIEKTEKSLSEYYGRDAEEFKRWAKNDFDAAIGDTIGDLRTVKRYADERAAKASAAEEAPVTTEQITEAYKQLKKARWESEKAKAKNLLTDHDNIQLGRLLRGEIELKHLDPKTDNVKGITAVYEATTEYERLVKLLTEYKQKQRAKLREEADKYLETANDWKDKKAGILYSRETMERNILDIVKDKKLAQEIIAEYFTPVHEAQAKSTRLKNKMRERVRALNLSTKETKAMQKAGKVSEAHAVQLLGEAMDNIRMLEASRGRMAERDGKTLSDWRGIVQEMWAQNPQLDKAKIEHAVEEFRSIYDELFKQMNEARVRNGYEPVNYRSGYFPHFQPGDGDGIMGLFGKALGIDTQVTALPTTINGLTHTFRPGIQWFGNAQQRLGFDTAYDAVEGFDRYIEGVADVIYQTDNIQKLRALATQARYRTGDEGLRKQVDTVYADPRLTEEEKRSKIDSIYEDGRFALSNFVVELEEYTNLLANKKSRADRNMEQALGRNMYNLVKGLESRVAANMVAINPASWLTNFIPLTQGGAMLNRGELLRGMWQTLRSFKESDGIVDASTFLTNRKGSDPLVRTWAQQASATMSSPMEYIDQFTAGSLVRARYNQNLKRGMSETAAMTEADSWTAGVMADRSKGSMPTLFNRSNPLTKVFTQFQLEVNNQLSYLFKDMPRGYKEKGLAALAVALFKFFLGAWLYDEVYEYFIGRRPALDPIGILKDTVGDITGYELPNLVELGAGAVTGDVPSFETEKKNAYDTVTGAPGNVAEELPFIGGVLGGGRVPISSALPDWDNLLKTVTSEV